MTAGRKEMWLPMGRARHWPCSHSSVSVILCSQMCFIRGVQSEVCTCAFVPDVNFLTSHSSQWHWWLPLNISCFPSTQWEHTKRLCWLKPVLNLFTQSCKSKSSTQQNSTHCVLRVTYVVIQFNVFGGDIRGMVSSGRENMEEDWEFLVTEQFKSQQLVSEPKSPE